jgi:mRNA-degrading endonuclease RelE of RelBE toxin-antitoxin system
LSRKAKAVIGDSSPELKDSGVFSPNFYKQLLLDLQSDTDVGEEIHGHQNFYKARYQNPEAGKGKSCGFRVIYHFDHKAEKKLIILVDIYSKTSQETVNWDRVKRAMAELEENEEE